MRSRVVAGAHALSSSSSFYFQRFVVIETDEYRRYQDWNALVTCCRSAMATLLTLFRSSDVLNAWDADTFLYVCLLGDHIETFCVVLKYLQHVHGGGAVVALYTNPIYLLEDAMRRRSRAAVLNVLECCSFRGAAPRLCGVIASGYWRAYAGTPPVHIYAAVWKRLGGGERRRLHEHLLRDPGCDDACDYNVALYFEALDRIQYMSLSDLVALDIPVTK